MKNYRKNINELLLSYKTTNNQLKEQHQEVIFRQNDYNNCLEAQTITQTVSLIIQQQAHNQIAEIVTKCLQTVFGEDSYDFNILFEEKRNRTEARLVFEKNGEYLDPMSASGGGVVDVASFALRLSCLLLVKPQLRRILIMDEPFKFVSSIYRDNIRQLLEELSKELDVQFIMVTHINELVTGNIIRL